MNAMPSMNNLGGRLGELDRRIRLQLAKEQGEDYVDIDRLAALLKCERRVLMLAVTIQSLPCVVAETNDEQQIVVNVSQAIEWYQEMTEAATQCGLNLDQHLMTMVSAVDESVPEDLLSPEQVVSLWGLSLDELKTAITLVELNTYKIGDRSSLVSEAEVVEWMEQRQSEEEVPEPEEIAVAEVAAAEADAAAEVEMPTQIELSGEYKISDACARLHVPEKTLQGAVTRGDMKKHGLPAELLPKKHGRIWLIPAAGLARWYNELYRTKSHRFIAVVGEAPVAEASVAEVPEPEELFVKVPLAVPVSYKDIDDATLMSILEKAHPSNAPDADVVARDAQTEIAMLEVDPDLIPLMVELATAWKMPLWAVLTLKS